jgi:hypothetical protein
MVQQDLPERDYQAFLEREHWMFGSQYVERVTDRTLVVGDQQDFVLRTTDGFYDVIEIKRPQDEVSRFDPDHQNHFPSPTLAKALGQVLAYLSHLDTELANIRYRQGPNVYRSRAVIVLGRMSEDQEAERKFIRDLNASLARVRVQTYTELLDGARQIVRATRDVMTAVPAPTLQVATEETA